MTGRRTFTVGTHNLHDDAGMPTFFADVIGFTEAVPRRVRDRRRGLLGRVTVRMVARFSGYRVISRRANRSLVLAIRRDLFEVEEITYYRAHCGKAKVTPSRGTLVVLATHRRTGSRCAFLLEHRINAAFPPYVRGEGELRRTDWETHQAMTLRLVKRYQDDGRFCVGFGDLNTPSAVFGYRRELLEVGHGYDRLACTTSGRWTGVERLSRVGSDHGRLCGTITLPKEAA